MAVLSFGDLLKGLRLRAHMSQRALAEKMGVHRNTIWAWEQGSYLPDSKSMVLELARLLRLDESEGRQLLEASLTALSPHWSVPVRRNQFFTGREGMLDSLYQALHPKQNSVGTATRTYALQGLGGIGKTQIALEYAYRYALEYSAVFWIEAETSESMIASMVRLAGHLQLPERGETNQQRIVTAVQQWLATHNFWLLIWDNVENLDLLQEYLPFTLHGTVLITTRLQALGTLAQGLALSIMPPEEGVLFLLRRARILSLEASQAQVQDLARRLPGEYAAAEALERNMAGLPLALDQAGAYIDETGCSIADYVQCYTHQRTHLLNRRGMAGRDHPHTVTTTFSLAYTQVRQKQPLAADLICLCAFLGAESIPEELFLSNMAHLSSTKNACAGVPFLADLHQFDLAIAVLRNFSLIQRHPETRTLLLHRLVQVILQEGMSEQERANWHLRAVHLLNAVFPAIASGTGTDIWELCERLLPHVIICAAALPTHLQGEELADLLLKAADYLDQRSQYERAQLLYQQALQIQAQVAGGEHPKVASLQSKLAYLYRLLGNYEQAECLFQSAERILEQAWGPEHPDVAFPLEGLAMVYFEQGKYDLALPLQQRALRVREQTWGPEHPEVALSLNRLGNVYLEQGKYNLAERVYQRALQIREQTGGPEHVRVASPLNNLGNLYREQGKYEQAEPFCQRAVRLAEQTLGAEHPDVAVMLGTLADLYREWGKYEQAEPLYQRALALFEQALGPEHHAGAYPLHGLALLYREQGCYEQAETLFQRTLHIREQRLGRDHPETAQTLYDLAQLHKLQGKMGEASVLAERALQIRLQSLGSTHPKTLASRTFSAQLEEARGSMQR